MREGNPLSVVRKERQRLEQRIARLEADNELLRLEKDAALRFLMEDDAKIKRLETALAEAQGEEHD